MVHAAKSLAVNMGRSENAEDWRAKNNLVSYLLNYHLVTSIKAETTSNLIQQHVLPGKRPRMQN